MSASGRMSCPEEEVVAQNLRYVNRMLTAVETAASRTCCSDWDSTWLEAGKVRNGGKGRGRREGEGRGWKRRREGERGCLMRKRSRW